MGIKKRIPRKKTKIAILSELVEVPNWCPYRVD